MSNRISADNTLTDSLSDFINATNYLISDIITLANTSRLLQHGYAGVYYLLVQDFAMLKSIIGNFVTVYKSVYKNRQLASQNLAKTVSHVTDLDNLMQNAPESYDNYFIAHLFYTTTLMTLSNSITNAKLSIDYLTGVRLDEESQPESRFSPDTLYNDSTTAQSCNSLYNQTLLELSKFLQAFSYASQKVSLWLQNNSANILNSTIEIAIVEDHFRPGNASSVIPGLWMLLECVECNGNSNLSDYRTWEDLFTTSLRTSNMDSLNNCLSQYEQSLQSTYSSTIPVALLIPSWNLNDQLMAPLASLNVEVEQTKMIIHKYIAGLDSLESTIAIIESNLLSLTDKLRKIENLLLMSYDNWCNDVISWQNSISEQYMSFVKSIVSLSQFLPSNYDLRYSILNMYIWRRPSAQINTYSYDPIDQSVIWPILYDLRNYFQNYVSSIINKALTNATQYNLQYGQEYCDTLQSLWSTWYSQVNNITNIINQFKQKFMIDDDVIR